MRYYFHYVLATERIEDQEGSELPDLQSAREEAEGAVRDLLADELRSGVAILPFSFEIYDEQGQFCGSISSSSIELLLREPLGS